MSSKLQKENLVKANLRTWAIRMRKMNLVGPDSLVARLHPHLTGLDSLAPRLVSSGRLVPRLVGLHSLDPHLVGSGSLDHGPVDTARLHLHLVDLVQAVSRFITISPVNRPIEKHPLDRLILVRVIHCLRLFKL